MFLGMTLHLHSAPEQLRKIHTSGHDMTRSQIFSPLALQLSQIKHSIANG